MIDLINYCIGMVPIIGLTETLLVVAHIGRQGPSAVRACVRIPLTIDKSRDALLFMQMTSFGLVRAGWIRLAHA